MSAKKQATGDATKVPDERTFFVDEAGDAVFFGRRGKVLVGTDGCSRYFMLGLARIENHAEVFKRLNDLRAELLADPYFKGVPSMQPEGGKTHLCFHAKNDPAEVRREVFKLLPQMKVKVRVVLRDKQKIVEILSQLRAAGMGFRIQENEMYDSLVRELFHSQLHEADSNKIIFARRGKSDRIKALADAIVSAKAIFRKHVGISADKPCEVTATSPSECVGLQVIDYYLWAYQRMKEKNEDRFFSLLADQFELIPEMRFGGESISEEMRRELGAFTALPTKSRRPSNELGSDESEHTA